MTTKYPLRVYFEDTDCTGVVYHANYLKFFERARSEWVAQHGLGLERQEKEGVYFAIRHANVEYFRPARLLQQLEVVSRALSISAASILYEQCLYLQNEPDTVLCRAEIKLVCIDSSYRPRAWPQSWLKEINLLSGDKA